MENTKEYEILRNEMIAKYNHIQANHAILYTAIGAVLIFALKPESDYNICIFLTWFIIIPLYLTIERQHKHVARIGTYLYVFHEGEDYNWERRHHNFEEKHYSKYRLQGPILFYGIVAFCYIAAVFKCFRNYGVIKDTIERKIIMYILSYLHCVDEKIYVCLLEIIIISIFILPAMYIIKKFHVNYISLRKLYIHEWEVVKEEEMRNRI